MNWQERTELLAGTEGVKKLNESNILVVGLGGVGACAAEMLCRAGIGRMTIVDSDVVSESNINRQMIAFTNTVGKKKTDVLREKLKLINPDIELICIDCYVTPENTEELFKIKYDYVVDAIDTLAPKVSLIKTCMDKGIPLVSSMGAGAKLDPEKITIADISKSKYCPLAHQLRKRLHRLGIKRGFKVVFSIESSIETAMQPCEERNKKTMVGTISYMPAIFGCMCASTVIRDIITS